jgi:hypothetical protein
MILGACVFAGFTVAYVRLGSLLALLLLSGCGEAASCWNHIKDRATTCEQMRMDEAERNKQERYQ